MSFAGSCLSYRELWARAERLAGRLGSLGIGPEVRVGLLASRSLELMVGVLGILAAGGAYVPLDPSFPPERLGMVLSDASVEAVVAEDGLAARLPAAAVPLVSLGRAESWEPCGAVRSAWASPRPPRLRDLHLGLDGASEGGDEHPPGDRQPAALDAGDYGLTAADRVLQKTPFSFDVSVWEFFWPLLAGARLVMAEPEGHKDPRLPGADDRRGGGDDDALRAVDAGGLRGRAGEPGPARALRLRRVIG